MTTAYAEIQFIGRPKPSKVSADYPAQHATKVAVFDPTTNGTVEAWVYINEGEAMAKLPKGTRVMVEYLPDKGKYRLCKTQPPEVTAALHQAPPPPPQTMTPAQVGYRPSESEGPPITRAAYLEMVERYKNRYAACLNAAKAVISEADLGDPAMLAKECCSIAATLFIEVQREL